RDQSMPRRLFLKLLVSLGLTKFFPSLDTAQAAPASDRAYKNFSLDVEQLITSEPRTSRTLMFRSTDPIENIFIEYKMIGDDQIFISRPSVNRYEDLFIASSTIDQLKPESVYEYRLINGERATAWKKFSTPGFGRFQMLIFCDSQCVDYGVWKSVADLASKNFPDAELATVIGDITDNGQYAPGWRGWHDGAARLLSTRIFAPVMGNHECYEPVNWLNCIPVGYLNHFVQPSNGSTKFNGYFYSFDYGAVHFIVLNTQFDELEQLMPGLEEAQSYWLRRDVANANRPWLIVLMHKDIFDYMQDTFSDVGNRLMPLFDELNIDLVLTGHLHTYRNRGHIFEQKKSDHGPVYVMCGLAGDQRYTEKVSAAFDEVAATPKDNYLVLDADAEELRLRCFSVDGTAIDDLSIRK
ncbi:MAG: metallophosphoesterase family protein, partial [Selenomonadaceae bacterium]|nr:metallophosphoesterase family protein [Selenomonadaceae bacterium]